MFYEIYIKTQHPNLNPYLFTIFILAYYAQI